MNGGLIQHNVNFLLEMLFCFALPGSFAKVVKMS